MRRRQPEFAPGHPAGADAVPGREPYVRTCTQLFTDERTPIPRRFLSKARWRCFSGAGRRPSPVPVPVPSRPAGTLTVRVALLPDAVHPAVGVDAQEEAAVLAVEPLGVLEVPGGESAAAPVVGQRRQRGDAPRRRHAPGPGGAPPPRAPAAPRRQLRAASSPAAAVQPRLALPGRGSDPVPSRSPGAAQGRCRSEGRREEGGQGEPSTPGTGSPAAPGCPRRPPRPRPPPLRAGGRSLGRGGREWDRAVPGAERSGAGEAQPEPRLCCASAPAAGHCGKRAARSRPDSRSDIFSADLVNKNNWRVILNQEKLCGLYIT